MLTHRGFSAWIVCEGRELPELDIVVDTNANKVSCWIPCVIGKTFAVHWLDQGTSIDSAAYINLDGFTVPGRFLYGLGAAQRGSMRVGAQDERPFQFASPDLTTEKGDMCVLSNTTSDVGTISLKIKQIRRTSLNHSANPPLQPPKHTRFRRDEDEACIGFGPKQTTSVQHEKTWSFVPYDKTCPGSFVQFIFRYRTMGMFIAAADLVIPLAEHVLQDVSMDDATNLSETLQASSISTPGISVDSMPLFQFMHTSHAGMSYSQTPASAFPV